MYRVLLVDDDADIRESIAAMLSADFEVVSVDNGTLALEKLNGGFQADILLLDVKMRTPQEGFELVKQLSEGNKFSDLPVLLITSTETMTASEATAEIVRKTREKYGVNTMNVLVIKNLAGDIVVDYKSLRDGSTVSIQVAGYHEKPVNPSRLIREIKTILSGQRHESDADVSVTKHD